MAAGSLACPMRIAPDLYAEMISHAREEAPNVCGGLIAAEEGGGVKLYRAVNAAASPLRYEVEPHDQYRIEMAIDGEGWELGAIYHSHTRSAPYPSQTDINLAFHPDATYLIVGVAGEEPDVRAFSIREGDVQDAELIVE